MDSRQLGYLTEWFNGYVAPFYGQDNFINANIKLKEDHSRRTADEMRYLAGSLGLNESDTLLSEAIGLLHDIGRFEQFASYRTYNDSRSANHSLLGRKILREKYVLSGLDQCDMGIIETAIEYHGVCELPPCLEGRRLLFTKLIRDADKIDIFEVSIANWKKYAESPQSFGLEIEFPPSGYCTQDVIEAVLKGEKIDYRRLRTMEDVQLLQLGWVFDINFKASLNRIKDRRYLEMFTEILPQKPELASVSKSIINFVNDQLSREGAEVESQKVF